MYRHTATQVRATRVTHVYANPNRNDDGDSIEDQLIREIKINDHRMSLQGSYELIP